jgi:putative cardiolipin synthase
MGYISTKLSKNKTVCLKGGHSMKTKSILAVLGLSLMTFVSTGVFAQSTPESDIYPYRTTSIDKNEMQVISTGIAALYSRLDMIRRATTSLDLEYFIFNPDMSGRIVVKELIAAAKRGVKVRVLIDKSAAVFKLDEYYAKALSENNIELRYYNPAPFIKVSSVQFRNHRKLLVRDGVEAITGGRNIADEYFNLSTTFNFLDRDVWVEGDIVKAMHDTFDLYWKSDIVQIPGDIKAPTQDLPSESIVADVNFQTKLDVHNKRIKDAQEFVSGKDEDTKTLDFILDYGKKALASTNKYNCPEASFATDREGASFLERIHSKSYKQNYRLLRKEITEWIGKVQEEIVLDSPYFLIDPESRKVVADLLGSNKKITILTNSLASTDAVYVSTVFANTVRQYTQDKNFNAYIYNGTFSGESEVMNDEIKKSVWGTHSKTIVFNSNSFMVGTFNIDNRSSFYNTEMALFCSGSPELTNDVLGNIQERMKNSRHLNKAGFPDDGTPLLQGTSLTKKLLYYMLKLPASIAQFLL